MVEGSVDAKDPLSKYAQVKDAAVKREDDIMLARLAEVPNGDLVAVEAGYHRKKGCFGFYTMKRKVEDAKRKERKIRSIEQTPSNLWSKC